MVEVNNREGFPAGPTPHKGREKKDRPAENPRAKRSRSGHDDEGLICRKLDSKAHGRGLPKCLVDVLYPKWVEGHLKAQTHFQRMHDG